MSVIETIKNGVVIHHTLYGYIFVRAYPLIPKMRKVFVAFFADECISTQSLEVDDLIFCLTNDEEYKVIREVVKSLIDRGIHARTITLTGFDS